MFKRIISLPYLLLRQNRHIHHRFPLRNVEEPRDISNITNILNELNNDTDFNSARNVRYRTTASQLVEEMNKKAEKQEKDNQEDTIPERKFNKTNSIEIERYLQTHTIYDKLKLANFTEKQCKLIMKLILSQLQQNTNQLIQNYSPNLDLENENYLFQAAQQELKSEVASSRDTDLDFLINSSILLKRSFQSLEDELVINYKMMDNSMTLELNQFKHENNLHNKQLDLKNQDLNNKIITDIVGDLRSYTESLRWQLTRNALFTILAMAILLISSYTFIKNLEDDDEVKNEMDKTKPAKKISDIDDETAELLLDAT